MEAHLMVDDPTSYVKQFALSGFQKVYGAHRKNEGHR